MDRGLAVVLTAAVGGLIALQAPVNSMLGKAVGTWQAAAVSFAIGTVLLVAIVLLAAGGLGELGVERQPATALRVLGVVLLGLGTYLVVRE
jgi:uncharacterized membrane protein YdcZ (DUF606 family)